VSTDAAYVFTVLAVTIALFLSDRIRLDIVAILVVLALMLGGQLTSEEALAGFGDPVVVLIAGLFVVGEGLFKTGIAHAVGGKLSQVAGRSETRLLAMMMVTVAVLSAFMSSTGAVAVFIPVVLSLAARSGIAPPRLLMPLAFASLIGGMLTLIGTPPNLIVNAGLRRAGFEVFNFFAFTPIGLLILIAGVGYMVTIGGRLLGRAGEADGAGPQRATVGDLIRAHQLETRFFRLQVTEASPLAGQTIGEALLRTRYGVTVMGIERTSGRRTGFLPGLRDTELRAGDVLLVSGEPAAVDRLADQERGQLLPADEAPLGRAKREAGVAEVLIPPESRLIDKTVRETAFRSRFGLTVLAILRGQERLAGEINDVRLAFGDLLLLGGGWDQISALQRDPANLLVVRMPAELGEVAPARRRAPLALVIGLGMLVLMTLNLVPSVTAVLIAALAMVLAGCVSMPDAYRAINWQSLVLIAGMIPMATALDKSGAMALIVDGLMAAVGGAGPMALLAVLFLLTSLLSQVISNTATTVLLAPVAIGAAQGLEVAPYPLVMAVAIAASTAFATPVASPVNTLVLGPGNYRFIDFVKVGVPLQLIAMVVALVAIPLLFPF